MTGITGEAKSVIGKAIAAIIAGALIPQALNSFFNGAQNASWDPATLAIYNIVSILIMLGIVFSFTK